MYRIQLKSLPDGKWHNLRGALYSHRRMAMAAKNRMIQAAKRSLVFRMRTA